MPPHKFLQITLLALVACLHSTDGRCEGKSAASAPNKAIQSSPSAKLPKPGNVFVDQKKRELILSAKVQFPEDKPCIDDYGQRIQAFAGCSKAAGGDAKMAAYFVFLVDVETEVVFEGLRKLGCRPRVHYSIQEGRKRSGYSDKTTPADYLQGDPVVLSVFWKDKSGKWIEKAYQHFATEKVTVKGREIVKPWTPHFVFHGSGAIHKSGTGCIACPCDCPGGIIADNRFPIYDPKPVVRFDMKKVPPEGTQVYVKIRPIASLPDPNDDRDASKTHASSKQR
ncbi:MAG: YdjY domain-containing protein [Planctomycetaceae bacterium]